MNLEKFVAVSGKSGLFQLVANRNNGLILEDLTTGKRQFIPSRGHQFTPLATIGIYTDDGESAELKTVFQNMLDQIETLPPEDINASNEALRNYFAQILPQYEREKVSIGDIKKTIKWFNFLLAKDLLATTLEDGTEEE